MYPKFIITQDGVLKFGHVYLHKDLLASDELCTYGGGLWKLMTAVAQYFSTAVHSISVPQTSTTYIG